MNKVASAAFAASMLASLSACSILAPYDSEFQCERSRDFGKCTDVAGAYSEALGGEGDARQGGDSKKKSQDKARNDERAASKAADPALARANITRYKAAEYGELASIIEQPVTPIVAPPKLLRTLVVAYATPEKTLYLPRYVYYFVTDGNFVLGDYLNAEKPGGATTIYPNGARQ